MYALCCHRIPTCVLCGLRGPACVLCGGTSHVCSVTPPRPPPLCLPRVRSAARPACTLCGAIVRSHVCSVDSAAPHVCSAAVRHNFGGAPQRIRYVTCPVRTLCGDSGPHVYSVVPPPPQRPLRHAQQPRICVLQHGSMPTCTYCVVPSPHSAARAPKSLSSRADVVDAPRTWSSATAQRVAPIGQVRSRDTSPERSWAISRGGVPACASPAVPVTL